MTGHRLTSRPLAGHPHRHRWAWYCSCGWWLTGPKAVGLAILYEGHLTASAKGGL